MSSVPVPCAEASWSDLARNLMSRMCRRRCQRGWLTIKLTHMDNNAYTSLVSLSSKRFHAKYKSSFFYGALQYYCTRMFQLKLALASSKFLALRNYFYIARCARFDFFYLTFFIRLVRPITWRRHSNHYFKSLVCEKGTHRFARNLVQMMLLSVRIILNCCVIRSRLKLH